MFLLLSACLIDTDLYERRKSELTDSDGDGHAMLDDCDDQDAGVHPGAPEVCDGVDQDCDDAIDEEADDLSAWFADVDGDGHGDATAQELACEAPDGFVEAADDCDDADGAVRPGAADEWYDGVDANCDGADDYDADGDGDRWDEAGGSDCDDEDPRVASTIEEGWFDAGVDNNCDGSIEDQARTELGDIGTTIDGSEAGGSLGVSMAVLPAGWADVEPVLLVSEPFTGTGDVYGWRASELAGSPALASATWHVSGSNEGDYLGYGLGWAGDATTPIVILGAEGALETRGAVEVWVRAALTDSPTLTITGETVGAYLGSQVVSGYDHDGDGIAEVVVTAQLDSRLATNAGAAFVFLGADGLSGEIPISAADIEFTTTYAGAFLSVAAVGDVDDDGLEDLGFDLDVSFEEGPGGLLVEGGIPSGSWDIQDASLVQIYAAGNAYGRVMDWNGDGHSELLVASGGLELFELPQSGAVTPWDDAAMRLEFTDDEDTVTGIRTDLDGFADHSSFLAISSTFDGGRGGVFVHSPYWEATMTVEASRFAAIGERAGDGGGTALEILDYDEDGVQDLAVGASGADGGGDGSGAVYLVRGPR